MASERVSRSFLEASIVAIGYVVFSAGNFHALSVAHKQLLEFAALARRVANEHTVQMPALQRAALGEESGFYWAVVIGVCIAILLITYRRRSYDQQPSMWA